MFILQKNKQKLRLREKEAGKASCVPFVRVNGEANDGKRTELLWKRSLL